MKSNTFNIRAFMMLIMFCFVSNAWGADATLVFSDQGYENAQQISSGTIDSYTSWTAENGSIPTAYYNTGSGLRIYNGGKFIVISTRTIASITLTFSSTGYTFSVSDTTTPQTVTPNATSYSWDVSRTCRLQKVEVTYAAGSTPTTYNVTIANNIANGTVTASTESATAGTEVTLTATPADGYKFGSWNVTYAPTGESIEVTGNTFIMPAANVNVSAEFREHSIICEKTEWKQDTSEGTLKGESNRYHVECRKTTGNNIPAYYASGRDVRIYADGTITIYSDSPFYEAVFYLSAQGQKRLAEITADCGTIDKQKYGDKTVVWHCSEGATSVTFTVGKDADYGSEGNSRPGQLCFTSIDMTPNIAKRTPVITLKTYETNLEVSQEEQDYLEIEYSVDDEDVPDFYTAKSVTEVANINKTGEVVRITPAAEGISTILVSAYETNAHKSVSTRFYMIVNALENTNDDIIWTKVTTVDELADGDEIIIVATEDKKAFCEISTSSGVSQNRGLGYDVTMSDDGEFVTNAKYASVFKIVASGDNFGLSLVGKGYLKATSGKANIGWSEAINDLCCWHPVNYVQDGEKKFNVNNSLFFNNIHTQDDGTTDNKRGLLYSKLVYNDGNMPDYYIFGNYAISNYGTIQNGSNENYGAYTQYYSPVAIYKRNHTLTLAANKTIEGRKYYYATFSNDDAVTFFPKGNHYSAVVETVDIEKIGGQNILDVRDLDETTIKVDKDNVVGYYVPAKAGVLIKVGLENDDKKNIHYYLMKKDDVEELENNKLRSASVPMEESGYKFYKLAYKEWNGSAETSNGLGFWWGADNGAKFNCKAGTAYLAIEADESSARGFVFDDVLDGIEDVFQKINDGNIFNLNGQRIATPIRGQVYIQNGKKFIAK